MRRLLRHPGLVLLAVVVVGLGSLGAAERGSERSYLRARVRVEDSPRMLANYRARQRDYRYELRHPAPRLPGLIRVPVRLGGR